MSASPAPELSRRIKVKGLPAEPVVIVADSGERAALAARFALPGIDHLRAEVALEQKPASIRATGSLKAAIRQTCAISGEDFPATIDEKIDLRFVEESAIVDPSEDDDEIEVELEADDCDEIEYSGDAFDLGEAVGQTLGLAIDPYAEGPDADAARKRAGIITEEQQQGPLASKLAEGLAALRKND